MNKIRLILLVVIPLFGIGLYAWWAAGHHGKVDERVFQLGPRGTVVTGEGILQDVEFSKSSDHSAVESFLGLKYSVSLATRKPMDYSLNASAIYLRGFFETEKPIEEIKHDPHQGSDLKKRVFVLTGWGMVMPFVDYPQGEADAALPPRMRTTLEETDFEVPIRPGDLKKDKGSSHYWIGKNPFDSLDK